MSSAHAWECAESSAHAWERAESSAHAQEAMGAVPVQGRCAGLSAHARRGQVEHCACAVGLWEQCACAAGGFAHTPEAAGAAHAHYGEGLRPAALRMCARGGGGCRPGNGVATPPGGEGWAWLG